MPNQVCLSRLKAEVIIVKDINIAASITKRRKERGITQDELARHMGVTKASVSKWETGISFPDIALLPQLATFFDISIDDLLAYNPQMTPDTIRLTYQSLTAAVSKKPFNEVLDDCRELIKKYYSCYPLLFQLGLFLMNNIGAVESPQQREDLTHEAIELFDRVYSQSDDPKLAEKALTMEGSCYLGLGDADTALVLLEASAREALIPSDIIVASAYHAKGEDIEARRFFQFGLFQNVVIQMNYFSNYLPLIIHDDEAFAETVQRARSVSDAYQLKTLHPAIYLIMELSIASAYATRGQVQESLSSIEAYTQTLLSDKTYFPLHGDSYFDLIEPWLKELETGDQLPMNSTVMKENLINAITENPAFDILKNEPRYKEVVIKLSSTAKE